MQNPGKRRLKLKKGLVYCNECDGFGEVTNASEFINPPDKSPYTLSSVLPCFKCRGTGQLDWIERVVGK